MVCLNFWSMVEFKTVIWSPVPQLRVIVLFFISFLSSTLLRKLPSSEL